MGEDEQGIETPSGTPSNNRSSRNHDSFNALFNSNSSNLAESPTTSKIEKALDLDWISGCILYQIYLLFLFWKNIHVEELISMFFHFEIFDVN